MYRATKTNKKKQVAEVKENLWRGLKGQRIQCRAQREPGEMVTEKNSSFWAGELQGGQRLHSGDRVKLARLSSSRQNIPERIQALNLNHVNSLGGGC